jgi:hypothetical protein
VREKGKEKQNMANYNMKNIEEITKITYEMEVIKLNPERATLDMYTTAYRRYCSTLRELIKNGDLERAIFEYDRLLSHPDNKRKAREILENIENLTAFISFERRVLVRAGLDDEKAEVLIRKLEGLVHRIKSRGELSAHDLWRGIQEFSNDICRVADAVGQTEKMIVEEYNRNKAVIMGAGVTTLVTNVAIGAATLGTQIWMVTASGMLGSSLISAALRDKSPFR